MTKRSSGLTIGAFALVILAGALLSWSLLHKTPSAATSANGGVETKNQNTAQAAEDPQALEKAAQQMKANELGLVPILVYHQIGVKEGRWTRTPANFRQDLQELYDRHYVLVALDDYINGDIKVPAGRSPAVITFDDSTAGQFRLSEKNGKTQVDPDCAVGILLDFDKQHPGFGHAATFFVNARPFGQANLWQQKLQLLNKWGFEIGNHTYDHKYLKGLSAAQVADEIVRLQQEIDQAVPGYQPKTFAIPQDGVPGDYNSLLRGAANGIKYKHDGVVLWAWRAAPSPFSKDFDPTHIQRIQVFQDQGQSSLVDWLNRISTKRYISDGQTGTVAIPKSWQEKLKDTHGRKPIVYDPGQSLSSPAQEEQAAKAKGVHVTFYYASSKDRWQKILDLINKDRLNAVQVDIKDESGRIGYLSQVKMAREIGSGQKYLNIPNLLAELKARHIYSIARIVIFKDPFLAKKKPQLMVRDKNGNPLAGGVWVDPYAKEVWDYNIDLAQEAYELGFDEVQFDYIRFPENARSARYGAADGRQRTDVIAGFLSYARQKLGWDKMLSATVFGFTGFAVDDLGIGQRPERFATYLNFISPMVYPSHYSSGDYGFANPNAYPYQVVDGSIKDINRLIESSGCRIRPWLQAFTLGPPVYGKSEVDAQIKATQDNDVDTYLLWNPSVNYKTL